MEDRAVIAEMLSELRPALSTDAVLIEPMTGSWALAIDEEISLSFVLDARARCLDITLEVGPAPHDGSASLFGGLLSGAHQWDATDLVFPAIGSSGDIALSLRLPAPGLDLALLETACRGLIARRGRMARALCRLEPEGLIPEDASMQRAVG